MKKLPLLFIIKIMYYSFLNKNVIYLHLLSDIKLQRHPSTGSIGAVKKNM